MTQSTCNQLSQYTEKPRVMHFCYSTVCLLLFSVNGRPKYKCNLLKSASIVLGIPTAKRESHSYLLQTLQSLIESMDEKEKKDSLIIVYVAEACMIQFKNIFSGS